MKKRKKIVLLLGAGFPVAWGAPFSKDILDRIIEDKEYMYDSNTTWGKFIFDTLKSFYEEEDGVTVNFETVIAASESIMNYVIASTNDKLHACANLFVVTFFHTAGAVQIKINEADHQQRLVFCDFNFAHHSSLKKTKKKRFVPALFAAGFLSPNTGSRSST